MDPGFHFRVMDDHLPRADRKERDRISGQLLRHISEMAVVDEIRNAVLCHCDWNREPQLEDDDTAKDKMPQFRREFIYNYQKKLNLPEVAEKVYPRLATFCKEYPWPKGKMDSAWLERATASRENLRKLWSYFRIALKLSQEEEGFAKECVDEDWAALSAAERQEHLQLVEEERLRIVERLSKPSTSLILKDEK